MGKGIIKLEKYPKVADALLAQVLKNNILSVGQMDDRVCIIVFTSTK